MDHKHNETDRHTSQTRWRTRTGVRIATIALSLAALGGGVVVASQPVQAATQTKSPVTTATTAAPIQSTSFSGWGG